MTRILMLSRWIDIFHLSVQDLVIIPPTDPKGTKATLKMLQWGHNGVGILLFNLRSIEYLNTNRHYINIHNT